MKKTTKKAGLVVKTSIKGGYGGMNHNSACLKATKKAGLVVKTAIRSGYGGMNHNPSVLAV
jgi:hypothetical protein